MARFVGDHADDLFRIVGSDQEAGIDKEVEAARDERVEAHFGDEVDRDVVGRIAGGRENWLRVGADDIFHFRIADELHPLRLGAMGNRGHRRQEGDGNQG